ncbi:MAG: UbiD family decarboxylase [Deltaproteobacteria bacterium]|nr:UbiD family decarboxylase [Deltaproteobacteria bacterium]
MGPYDSLRDYVADLEERGKLIRIKEIDQDRYESTALMFRMLDRMKDKAPGIFIEKTKVIDRWYETPVVGNLFNGYDTIAQCFGVEPITNDPLEMYNAAVEKIEGCQQPDGKWKQIAPKEVSKEAAPCKEVILKGKDADLQKFPWIKNNACDAGQYISAGCFIMEDPELGKNVGTYRMQVKESYKAGANFTNQSHAYAMMVKAGERNEDKVDAAVAIGIDPISWMMSSTRLADQGEDEFAIAGGFRGKPVELVKCEGSDLLVPAHAEFIIEGEIPMEVEQEGPYGEMFGYLGRETTTFYLNVKTITHRKNPWVYNLYTGLGSGYFTMPWDVGNLIRMKKLMPNLIKLYSPPETPTIVIASIDKKFPGEGIEAGMLILGYRMIGFSKKIVIIVDTDVEPSNITRVLHAVGTRWQPVPASLSVHHSFHMPIDPSLKEPFMSSKIIIDATRQLPSEGGPDSWVPDLRSVMEEKAPDAFDIVDKKWDEYFSRSK